MGDESGRAVVRPVRQQAGLPNWWKVCFVHGDQTKFYRQLYGHKRAAIRTQLQNDNARKVSSTSEEQCACADSTPG